jgi:hypothetical protein
MPHCAEHVVEVYGLTVDIKTCHLEAFLEAVWDSCGGSAGKFTPTIRWVDDEHALFVCPDIASGEWVHACFLVVVRSIERASSHPRSAGWTRWMMSMRFLSSCVP